MTSDRWTEIEFANWLASKGGSIARVPKPAQTIRDLTFTVPIKAESEMNCREHWASVLRRKKSQRDAVLAMFSNALRGREVDMPCIVTLTRIGPRKLDDDNLRSAFKGIRDAIAARLGVDDGSDQIRFEYKQIPIRTREYSIKVGITH